MSCDMMALKRPSVGALGKPFKARVNYFNLPKQVLKYKFVCYKVDISFEKIDPDGIFDDSKQVPNRNLRRDIFWEIYKCNKELVVYDDWDAAYFAEDRGNQYTRCIELRNRSKVYIVIKPFSKPFLINLIDSNPWIAQQSEKLLKSLVTQGCRFLGETNKFFSHGGSVYPVPGQTKSAWDVKIHNDIRAWIGLYAGVRTMSNKDPVINFALTHKLFHQMDIDLVTFFVEVLCSLDSSIKYQNVLSSLTIRPEYKKRLQKALEGLKVRTKKEMGGAISFKNSPIPFLAFRHGVVKEVSDRTALSKVYFGPKLIGTFREIYYKLGAGLKFPNLPLIRIVCQKREYEIPMELLYTYDTPTAYKRSFEYFAQQTKYIEKVSHTPTEYVRLLLRAVAEFSETSKNQNFHEGVIKPEMLEIEGRRLKPPQLLDSEGNPVSIYDDYSYRNLKLNKCPEQEVYIALIHVLEDTQPSEPTEKEQHIKEFYEALKPKLQERGLTVNNSDSLPADLHHCNIFHINRDIGIIVEKEKQKCTEAFGPNFREKLALLFLVVFDDVKEHYGHVKALLDRDYGYANQGIDGRTLRKAILEPQQSRSIYYNLALKINAKLGGVNIEAENFKTDRAGNSTEIAKVMYIGMDCTHPSDETLDISIASMTGSIDASGTRYVTETYAQLTGKERIDYFNKQFQHLIAAYREENGFYPEHIIVYRDGVSNSEILQIAANELQCMRSAWTTISEHDHPEMPTLTYIVLQKRHGTRFFVPNTDSQYENVESGSVFDTSFTSPILFDFWLCSQYSPKHTIRPGHYTVVHDDWKLEPDAIYEMTYRLCFLNARCRKAISLPVPIHYADIACSKIKEKYKALKKTESFMNAQEDGARKNLIEDALKTHNAYPGMPYI